MRIIWYVLVLLLVSTTSALAILSDLAWWETLLLALMWAITLISWLREYRRRTDRSHMVLQTWLQVGGDLLMTCLPGDDHIIGSVGPGFGKALGWSRQQMGGYAWSSFIHPDDMAVTLEHMDAVMAGQGVHQFTNRWRHGVDQPNGQPRWVWLEWNAIFLDDLQICYANARDMTARFEREAQMATWSRITTALMAVGDTSIPIATRKFEWINEAWSRQLGWTMHELYTMRIMDIIKISDIERVSGIKVDANGVQDIVECRVLCKGDPPTYRYYEWSSIDLNGQVYTTGRNVEAKREHRVEMARVIADLESRNADLERFASVAAHQLRSPPRTIAGIAQALKEDYGHLMDDEGLQFVEDIREDADQMAEIVDGLYRFSKVRTSADLQIEPVDLNVILAMIYDTKKKRGCWRSGGKDLLWDNLPTVLGNKVLLAEVFSNLVDNGFKFNESRQKVVTVTTGHREDGRWDIMVEDNGIGIDPQYHHKLFTMFERVHPHYKGTGVGLALVGAIVNKLGGSITVESSQGQGAMFTFDLEGAWTL